MKIKLIISVLIICFQNTAGFSQSFEQRVDSLTQQTILAGDKEKVLLFDELSRLFWDNKPDSSLFYSMKALEFAKKVNDPEVLGVAHNSIGNAYQSLFDSENALMHYQISKEYREKAGDKLKVAFSLNNIALAYSSLNKYSEAINSFKEAASICNSEQDFENEAYMLMGIAEIYQIINDNNTALEYAIKAANIFIHLGINRGQAHTYNFIGTLHKNLNNTNLALVYYEKAYQIFIKDNINDGISSITNNLGIVYDELGENDKALDYYEKSLAIAKQNNHRIGEAVALNNIGFLYSKTKSYQKALEAYEQSLKISEEMQDFPSIMNTNNNISWVYYRMGNLNKAKEYVNKALSFADKNNDLLFLAESHEILSKISYDQGQYKKGYEHQAKQMSINDSLFNINNNEKFVEMQVRFETERKEKEIEILKKNDEIKNLQIQRQKNVNIFWLIFSLLLISVAILVFTNLQSKKKNNKLLLEKNVLLEEANNKLMESEAHLKELNATKDRFFTLIAHDLKNPFTALMGFSEILQNNFENFKKEEIKDLIKIIFESSQNLYKLLDNLLQWSRSQTGSIQFNPENFPLLPLVKQEIEVLEPLAEKKSIKFVTRVEDHIMVYADKNLVAVIIRNLLNNAIKFSNSEGKITIFSKENERFVSISIADNGIGMDKEEKDKLFRLDTSFSSKGTADEQGTGLGLLLCKEFIEKNAGEISVTSEKGQGSTFHITLPLHRLT